MNFTDTLISLSHTVHNKEILGICKENVEEWIVPQVWGACSITTSQFLSYPPSSVRYWGTSNRCIFFFCRCTYLNTHIHGDISLSLRGFLSTGIVWSQGRQGRYIRTNSTGIRRRRSGVPRGTKMAPQGRPIKRRHGAQDLPMKAKRQKRIHDLITAIAKGRR